MDEKVFISCAVNSRKEYCADEYFQNIRNITYPNKQYYFSDNSIDPNYSVTLMEKYGFEVGYINPKGLSNVMYMCNSMNQCLQKFLASDCDLWLMLEEDNICPMDIVEQLISHDKMVVAAPYFINTGKDSILLKGEMEDTYGEQTNRVPLQWKEDYRKFNGKLTKCPTVGFGCTLVRRIIFEDYKFYANEKQKAHCDTMWSFDLHEAGIDVYVDSSIICEHKNQQWTQSKFN